LRRVTDVVCHNFAFFQVVKRAIDFSDLLLLTLVLVPWRAIFSVSHNA